MAIVGYFQSLAEAAKLVQSQLLAGVAEEIYKEGELLNKLPVTTCDSYSVKYNRESTIPQAAFSDPNGKVDWHNDTKYATQVEVFLRQVDYAHVLNRQQMDTWKNPNDYRTQVMKEVRKGLQHTVEDKLIYGKNATNGFEPDGLDVLVSATGGHTFAGGYQDYDMGGGNAPVTVAKMRDLVDYCKPSSDKNKLILMTRPLRSLLSAAEFEVGVSANAMARISMQKNEFGVITEYFGSVPILVSDFLTAENDNTGGKASSGNLVSVYCLRFGDIIDGGLSLILGGGTGGTDFFRMKEFDALEQYKGGGIQMWAWMALALGSTKAATRIHSINQTYAITA